MLHVPLENSSRIPDKLTTLWEVLKCHSVSLTFIIFTYFNTPTNFLHEVYSCKYFHSLSWINKIVLCLPCILRIIILNFFQSDIALIILLLFLYRFCFLSTWFSLIPISLILKRVKHILCCSIFFVFCPLSIKLSFYLFTDWFTWNID